MCSSVTVSQFLRNFKIGKDGIDFQDRKRYVQGGGTQSVSV